jgi:hypothetical protein
VPGSYRLSPVVMEFCANTHIAGSNVTVEMHQQPGDRSCTNEAIGGNHYGPVIIYMSKVSNAATDAGAGPWFKVSQEGYNVPNKWWGTVSSPCSWLFTEELLARSSADGRMRLTSGK